MKRKRSTTVNFLYNMIYQISLVILPLITSPYLSRTIGSEGLGNYSYTYTIAYYFYLFALLGINNFGNRNIASVRDDKKKLDITFSRIYYFQFIVGIFSTSIYIIYCICIVRQNKILALAQLFYVISAVISIDWFFFGLEEFRLTVIRKTVIKIATSIGIFLLVKSEKELILYALLISVAELLGEAYLWIYMPKYVKFVKVHIKDIFQDWDKIILLFIPIIATSVYRNMDKIMIGQLNTMKNVGQYDYAEKIIMICLGVMTALGTVMLPKIANLIANHHDKEVKAYIEKSMLFAMIIGIAMTFGLVAVGKNLAVIYFGKEYLVCGQVLQLLSITILPIAWANVIRTQYLIPSAKDKEYLLSVLAGAIINFILNYFLIPWMGLNGAIVGTIAAEYSVAIIQTLQVRKELEIKKYVKNSIPYIGIGIIMYGGIFFMNTFQGFSEGIIHLLLEIALGAFIYIVLGVLLCKIQHNFIYDYVVSSFKRILVKK